MTRRRHLLAATLLPWASAPVWAQPVATAPGASATLASPWPRQPVRLVVPFPPGGGTDIVARALASVLSSRWQQPVAVENKPGASTILGTDSVAKAAADSHVLLVSGSSTFTVNPALRKKLPYDAQKDLHPLGLVALAPLVLVVRADAPWKTLPELLAAARAKPGGLSYATFGPGSAPQLAGSLLAMEAGVQWLDVPYKGSAPALTDLLGGQIQFMLDTAALAGPQLAAGKLRALTTLSAKRLDGLPEVPSLSDLKLGGAVFEGWYGVAAPGAMVQADRQAAESALRQAVADPQVQAALRRSAMTPLFLGSQALKPLVEQEVARFRMVAHRARIVLD